MRRLLIAGMLLALLVGVGGCATGSTAPSGGTSALSSGDLGADVQTRLRNEIGSFGTGISTEANGTVVTLRGTVDRPETRARAAGVAAGTPGVTEVVNEITTRF